MPTNPEHVDAVAQLLKKFDLAVLTTTSSEGALTARPLVLQAAEFDGDLTFIVAGDSSAANHVVTEPSVGVAFTGSDTWLSISGHATITEDNDQLRELWDSRLEAWFPDGPESSNIVILRVDADSAEYWTGPGGKIASAISFVKSKITGETLDTGNEKVDL